MERAKFDKLWFIGNVKITVDNKKALVTVWKGHLGKVKLWSQIIRGLFALTLAGIGVWIMTKVQFELSPVKIGFSWWGAVLVVLALGIPFLMKNAATQAVKNKIIRDPEFYSLAQEMELFELEEYE